MSVQLRTVDEVVDELIATCDCDACRRYRYWFVSRVVAYAALVRAYARSIP